MKTKRTIPKPKSVNNGFSLLEMIVAIVIMAISLTALYQAVSGASRIIIIDKKYSYAHGIAQSLLADYATVPKEGLHKAGQISGGFNWQVKTQAIDTDLPAQIQPGDLQKIEIKVSWDKRNLTLHSIVAGKNDLNN